MCGDARDPYIRSVLKGTLAPFNGHVVFVLPGAPDCTLSEVVDLFRTFRSNDPLRALGRNGARVTIEPDTLKASCGHSLLRLFFEAERLVLEENPGLIWRAPDSETFGAGYLGRCECNEQGSGQRSHAHQPGGPHPIPEGNGGLQRALAAGYLPVEALFRVGQPGPFSLRPGGGGAAAVNMILPGFALTLMDLDGNGALARKAANRTELMVDRRLHHGVPRSSAIFATVNARVS